MQFKYRKQCKSLIAQAFIPLLIYYDWENYKRLHVNLYLSQIEN